MYSARSCSWDHAGLRPTQDKTQSQMNQVHFPKTSPPVLASCSPTCQGSLILKASLVIVQPDCSSWRRLCSPLLPAGPQLLTGGREGVPPPFLPLWPCLCGYFWGVARSIPLFPRGKGCLSAGVRGCGVFLQCPRRPHSFLGCFRPSGEGLGVITSSETGILPFAEARGSLRLRRTDFYPMEHDGEAP